MVNLRSSVLSQGQVSSERKATMRKAMRDLRPGRDCMRKCCCVAVTSQWSTVVLGCSEFHKGEERMPGGHCSIEETYVVC